MQLERLNDQIKYCMENVEYYKRKLKKILPEGNIKNLDEFVSIPFTTKEDTKKFYPYGMSGAPIEDIIGYNESSGTSGGDVNRSSRVVSFYTREDIENDIIRRTNGDLKISSKDIVFNALPYALTSSGIHFHMAAFKAGAMVIPADNGNKMSSIRKQVDIIRRINPSIIITSYPFLYASLFKMLGVSTQELTNLRAIQLCGMSTSEEGKKKISKLFNEVKVYDTYGMSEFGAITATCNYGKNHVNDDFYIEIINPRTLELVEDGIGGEIVITTLNRKGSPKLRYRTGDVGKIERKTCKCGRSTPKLEITGRLKDLIIIDSNRYTMNDFENVIYSHKNTTGLYKPEFIGDTIKFIVDIDSTDYELVAKEIIEIFKVKFDLEVEVECVEVGQSRKELFDQDKGASLKSLQSVNKEGDSNNEWLVTY